MNKTDIQHIMQKNPSLKQKLYAWGFVFTNFDISENGTQICASKCYHEIAECYYFIKKYKKAECYYFKALHIWEKCQDVCSEDYAELFSSLGYTYYMMNNSELACNYFRKSYEIQKKSQMNCNMKVIEEILKELSANNIQE